jgi:hypothetical protein
MNYHSWTKEEIDFLKANYQKIGDTYLAELMQRQFPRNDIDWNKKHIEKKRGYLKLKRSKKQENSLRCLNNKDGRHFKAWDKRGRAKEGEVRIWHGKEHIKIKGRFIALHRHKAKAKAGDVVRDGKIITRAKHAVMNRHAWLNFSPEIRETVTVLNKLKKIVYGKKNRRPERNTFRHNRTN